MRLTCFKYADTFLHEKSIFCRDWQEKYRPISLLFYLIETDGRVILADTGCDWLTGFVMQSFRNPAELLAESGVRPESVTDVILTHAHLDHAGGSGYFPGAVFHLQEDELRDAGQFLPKGAEVRLFREQADVSPGVRAVWSGGHTRGSSVVELDADGQKWVLTGDVCYLPDCFTRGIPTGASFCPERSLAFLRKYGDPAYKLLTFHDPDICPGGPGAYRII